MHPSHKVIYFLNSLELKHQLTAVDNHLTNDTMLHPDKCKVPCYSNEMES